MKLTTTIIGIASGAGAQIHTTAEGPQALVGLNVPIQQIITPKSDPQNNLQLVSEAAHLTYDAVKHELENKHFPIVIGGDHSIAIGTWSALASQGSCGLMWIDAHMDSHTVETSPSKAYHGMPLACLMGYGEPSLTDLGARLKPENIVLIGVRSWEEGEAKLLESLGVRIFKMPEIRRIGMAEVIEEALVIVNAGTASFGVSIDLDAFDPSEAPGVGTPEPNGLREKYVLPELSRIANHPNFKALELTEYNPHFDQDNKTALLLIKLMQTLTGYQNHE